MNQFIKDGSIRLGNVAHRFQHDEAVEAYCKANSFTNPVVYTNGEVKANLDCGPDGIAVVTIGWTF